jgi:hypothetical protein
VTPSNAESRYVLECVSGGESGRSLTNPYQLYQNKTEGQGLGGLGYQLQEKIPVMTDREVLHKKRETLSMSLVHLVP